MAKKINPNFPLHKKVALGEKPAKKPSKQNGLRGVTKGK